MAIDPNMLASSSVAPPVGGEPVAILPADLLRSEQLRRLELLEIEHKQRMEYARIEHVRRMEVIEEEAALVEAKYQRLAEQIAPSNDRLMARVGNFKAPPGAFDNEEMPY